jgi:hypothetical protein
MPGMLESARYLQPCSQPHVSGSFFLEKATMRLTVRDYSVCSHRTHLLGWLDEVAVPSESTL